MTTNGRKRVNMIWANEAGVSVYIYEAEHERRTIEIHGVVNDYETVLATATIEKHNRDRLAEAVGNDLQFQLEQLRTIAEGALRFRVEMNGACNHDEYMTKLCTQCEIRAALEQSQYQAEM